MPIEIKGYRLFMENGKRETTQYRPEWDHFVANYDQLLSMITFLLVAVRDGQKPVVTIFLPKEKKNA